MPALRPPEAPARGAAWFAFRGDRLLVRGYHWVAGCAVTASSADIDRFCMVMAEEVRRVLEQKCGPLPAAGPFLEKLARVSLEWCRDFVRAADSAPARLLHERPGAFVIANPWDGGSARLLAGLGFEALATSSGAKAGVLGKRDGQVTRAEALANARMIVEACDLPVAADLEKGFGDAPAAVLRLRGRRRP